MQAVKEGKRDWVRNLTFPISHTKAPRQKDCLCGFLYNLFVVYACNVSVSVSQFWFMWLVCLQFCSVGNQIRIYAHLCVQCTCIKSACLNTFEKKSPHFSLCFCLPAALSDEMSISSDSHFVVPFFLARLDCVQRESEAFLITCLWKQIRFYIF